jgi:hypothetical protein
VAPNQQVNIHFPMEKGMRTMNLEKLFLYINRIISAVKRVQFVRDRMSHKML